MSKKLDLYLEKIIAKMNLDDSQRENVEREFRAHLEEGVRECMEKGLTLEQAETEAMLAFGPPSVIARQFGVIHGFAWYAFESIALAMLFFCIITWITIIALRHIIKDDFHINYSYYFLLIIISSALLSLWFLSTRLWNKIEVNGTLRIYRLFCHPLSIPFEVIEKISLGGRKLWGRRKINIYFKGTKGSFHTGMRNFRCAALALDALCPHALEQGVSSFFRNIRYKIPKEGKWFRLGMTFFWLTILFLYTWFLIPVWNLLDISIFYFLIMKLVIPGLIFQTFHHKDRAKRGILYILLIVYSLYFSLLIFTNVFFTLTVSLKAMTLYFFGFIGTFLFFLWWKGRKIYLIFFLVLSFIILYPSRFFLTPLQWNGVKKVMMKAPFSMYNPVWINNSTLYAINAPYSKPQLLIHHENECETVKIDGYKNREWGIDRKNTESEAAIIYIPYNFKKKIMYPHESAKVFFHSLKNGLRKMDTIPTRVQFLPTILYDFSLFSPDDRYMITPLIKNGSDGSNRWEHELAFTHLETGKVTRFDNVTNVTIRDTSGWIDDKTFEIYYCSPKQENNQVKETLIQIYRFHLESEQYEVFKTLVVPGKVKILEWTSGNYIPAVFYPYHEIGFIDLNTSDTLRKKHFAQDMSSGFAYAWHDKTKKLAVLCCGKNHHYIAIIEPTGFEQVFPLDPQRIVKMMNFSPDGSKIFALSINSSLGINPAIYKYKFFPLIHYEVIDLRRGKRITIERLSIFESLMPFISGTFSGPVHKKQWLLWTPDSRLVVYQISLINLKEKQFYTEFRQVNYEDWAEKNL